MGMRGAALAQVDLNGLEVPVVAEAAGNEVHGITLQCPFRRQCLTDSLPIGHQGQPIALVAGKSAAQVGLAARSSQNLFMGGKHLHPGVPPLATRIDRSLHTG